MKFQATIDVELTDDDFETIIDMAGYGIDGWSRWAVHSVEEKTYTVHFWDDPDNPESPIHFATLSYRQIGEALVKLASTPERYDVKRTSPIATYALSAVTESDMGNVDSDLADCIIQIALFNKVIYS